MNNQLMILTDGMTLKVSPGERRKRLKNNMEQGESMEIFT